MHYCWQMTLHQGLVGVTCESNDYTHTLWHTGDDRCNTPSTAFQQLPPEGCRKSLLGVWTTACDAYIYIYIYIYISHTHTHTYASKPDRDIKTRRFDLIRTIYPPPPKPQQQPPPEKQKNYKQQQKNTKSKPKKSKNHTQHTQQFVAVLLQTTGRRHHTAVSLLVNTGAASFHLCLRRKCEAEIYSDYSCSTQERAFSFASD